MSKFVYCGPKPFECFIVDIFGNSISVSEDEFFKLVGFDRELVPMHYDKNNINRQNFYLNDNLIAYRVRGK
jgi:hypothetical protein